MTILSEATTRENSKQAPAGARVRLEFLDGLRGLAALYVALSHVTGAQGLPLAALPLPLALATGWTRYAHYAVGVFIVLSGYCLMLPVARAAEGRLRGGLPGFLKRRARRILPPYYAALGISLLLILAARFAKHPVQADEPGVFSPGNLLAHLTLLHNLTPAWDMSINVVLWSVATEWQIYFVFALLLLPVWRRLGNGAVIALAFLVGLLPHVLLPAGHNLDWACPWYLGLFALGMAGAVISFSNDPQRTRMLAQLPWGWLCLGFFLALCLLERPSPQPMQSVWLKDPLVGAATVCLILHCVRCLTGQVSAWASFPLRVLESRGAVLLGGFSYSLYLMNIPAMWVLKLGLIPLHPPPVPELIARLVVGPLWMIAVAYPFHLLFERPFLSAAQAFRLPKLRFAAGPRARPVVPTSTEGQPSNPI